MMPRLPSQIQKKMETTPSQEQKRSTYVAATSIESQISYSTPGSLSSNSSSISFTPTLTSPSSSAQSCNRTKLIATKKLSLSEQANRRILFLLDFFYESDSNLKQYCRIHEKKLKEEVQASYSTMYRLWNNSKLNEIYVKTTKAERNDGYKRPSIEEALFKAAKSTIDNVATRLEDLHDSTKYLTKSEEHYIIQVCKRAGDGGFGFDKSQLLLLINSILNR